MERKLVSNMKTKPMPKGQYSGDNDIAGKDLVNRAKKNSLNRSASSW